MPAIIESKQIYMAGQTPVYVAYIYTTNLSTPLNSDEIDSIVMTHSERREGLMGNRVVESWFPVESDGELLENILIKKEVVREPIDISDTQVFRKTTQTSLPGEVEQYNFLFIPVKGWNFYPNMGTYQTVFSFRFGNGKTENIVFESKVDEDSAVLTLQQPTETVQYGQTINFEGTLYAKTTDQGKGDTGRLLFTDERDITNVYLSVFNVTTAQVVDQKILGIETLNKISSRTTAEQAELNALLLIANPNEEEAARIEELRCIVDLVLKYDYNTSTLPRQPFMDSTTPNQYRFEFSIEVNNNDIICVFAIDIGVGTI